MVVLIDTSLNKILLSLRTPNAVKSVLATYFVVLLCSLFTDVVCSSLCHSVFSRMWKEMSMV